MWRVTVLIVLTIEFVFGEMNQLMVLVYKRPCDSEKLIVNYDLILPLNEKNQYSLQIRENFIRYSTVFLKFDSDAYLTLETDDSIASIRAQPEDKSFIVEFFKTTYLLNVAVRGPSLGEVPYLTSAEVNNVEYCKNPRKGYLDQYIQGHKLTATLTLRCSAWLPDEACGRRKIQHTEMMVNGLPTKPGEWPWHAAIYRFERSRIEYICGGTLLTQTFVVTAAHCVASRGVVVLPETRNVILGKYYLVGGDIAPQERAVHQIIIHEGFNHNRLDNDIALLKLQSEAVYGDYVQPACLWYSGAYKKLPQRTIHGTVVGWGFNHKDELSTTLQQATIPMLSEITCIRSNPLFFAKELNSQKFCAGTNNGTSACNGDSGGGFLVFVPDESGNTSHNATGAWYLRGIVSIGVSRTDAPICDPYQYVIFTDVAKFKGWLQNKMK